MSTSSGGPPSRLYSCVYALNNQKKLKSYKDGYLQCTPAKTTLLADTNKFLASASLRLGAPPKEDDELVVGQYLVVVGAIALALPPPQPSATVGVKKPRYGMNTKKYLQDEDDDDDHHVVNTTSSLPSRITHQTALPQPTTTIASKPRPILHPGAFDRIARPSHTLSHSTPITSTPTTTTSPSNAVTPITPASHHGCTPLQDDLPSHVGQQIGALAPVKRPLHATYTSSQHQRALAGKPSLATITMPTKEPYKFGPGTLVLSHDPPMYVPSYLASKLRPHQRDGVKFLHKCLFPPPSKSTPHTGALLCDDVGLGKSIQTIALLEAVLNAPRSSIKHAIIVCPATLVTNWQREIRKWIPSYALYASVVHSTSPEHVIHSFLSSIRSIVIIMSYETCRKYSRLLHRMPGILVCDEAHRLKSSSGNKTIQELKKFRTTKRILLTATPVQNNLDEFYAMADFACPGLLGTPASFTSRFTQPILRAQDTKQRNKPAVLALGNERSQELMGIMSNFVLRRTTDSISGHLPPKTECVVFCQPSPLQIQLTLRAIEYYKHTTHIDILPTLNILRKIATSPLLTQLTDTSPFSSGGGGSTATFASSSSPPSSTDSLVKHLQAVYQRHHQQYQSTGTISQYSHDLTGSKLTILRKMVDMFSPSTNILIVSSYTETLDIVEQTLKPYQCHRLDGTVPVSKRDDVITLFNNPNYPSPTSPMFNNQRCILLLSAKAAGAGLNLVNGCVTITCDQNWNPAIDTQVMGRMWRNGQKRHVFIFRLLTNGSIDEKIYQRQIAKTDIANSILDDTGDGDGGVGGFTNGGRGPTGGDGPVNSLTKEEMKQMLIFDYQSHQTYDMLVAQHDEGRDSENSHQGGMANGHRRRGGGGGNTADYDDDGDDDNDDTLEFDSTANGLVTIRSPASDDDDDDDDDNGDSVDGSDDDCSDDSDGDRNLTSGNHSAEPRSSSIGSTEEDDGESPSTYPYQHLRGGFYFFSKANINHIDISPIYFDPSSPGNHHTHTQSPSTPSHLPDDHILYCLVKRTNFIEEPDSCDNDTRDHTTLASENTNSNNNNDTSNPLLPSVDLVKGAHTLLATFDASDSDDNDG